MLLKYIQSKLHKYRHGNSPNLQSEMDKSLNRISSNGFIPNTVIDIGVGNGTQDLYSAFPDAYLYLIEPLVEFKPTIQSILSKRNGDYIIAAAGSSNSTQQINVHDHHMVWSSLFKESTPSIDDGIPREIPVYTVNHLVN